MTAAEKHIFFMKMALKQAQIAFEIGEIPVGALIIYNDKIIAKAYNQTQLLKDPTAHAEMLCITSACNFIGSKYLKDCTMYVTLEPCPMCAGAIKWAQLKNIVWGASDTKSGYLAVTLPHLFSEKTNLISGVLEAECTSLMKSFFLNKRQHKL